MPTLSEIESLTKTLATSREVLAERVQALHQEVEAAKRRKLPGIKSAVSVAKEAESKLYAAVNSSCALFESPRTIIAHGIKVGFAKGRGRIEYNDEKTVIARIYKQLPEQAEVLVKKVETIRKKALGALTVEQLRKLSCTVIAAGDAVYIAPVADDVDKLVNRMLKEDTPTE